MTVEDYESMDNISIKIRNYKCFGESPQGFEEIKPINVLIGRNNSGKSSLIDLIEYAVNPRDLTAFSHKESKPEIIMTLPLKESEVKKVFIDKTGGDEIVGNHWNFGKRFIGKRITIKLNEDKSKQFFRLDPPLGLKNPEYQNRLAGNKIIPFSHKIFKRIRAERDIKAELANGTSVDENGNGATNLIQQFLNNANLSSKLVEIKLLNELNKIVEPDARFNDIVIQRLDDGRWEIYLEEENKGRIALSHSGSGLKTILLVLIFIFLVPIKEKFALKDYIFALEEPENNLHPAVQRRLFLYLKDIALTKKVYFFITSHSNIAIDIFSNDADAQICHITHDGNDSISNPVKTYIDKSGVLDDLDVRASDLLQSNGIIWVEGPSDRLYVNKWIEIWSNGKLREGAHYQCVFYGGRLLAHLSADAIDDEERELIKIFLTNRNAAILIDSDKRNESDEINNTKKRILDEIKNSGGFFWITKGREIENYIPKSAVASYYGLEVDQNVDQYVAFKDYIENIKSDEGAKFVSNKVFFAEEIRHHLNKENLCAMLDFKNKMENLIDTIQKWNTL